MAAETSYLYTEVPVTLEKEVVKVPLPQDIHKIIKKLPLSETDVPKYRASTASNHETHFARFYRPESEDPLIPLYSYRILKSSSGETGDVLTICPIQINSFENLPLQSFSFMLPSSIVQNCITFRENVDHVVIDIILSINVVVTLNLDTRIFFNDDVISLNNFYSWCKYSMPYSFDQRKALFMKSFDVLMSVISTIDGGLLLMKRLNINSEFTVSPLTNTSYINDIRSKLFFGSSNSVRTIDFNNQSVSVNSFIDVLKINSDLFITISVSKTFTIWSLKSQKILKEVSLNDYLPELLHSAVLSPSCPNSILQLSNDMLTVLLSLDNTYIYTFRLNLEDISLNLVAQLVPPNCNQNWIPIDYCLISRNGFSKIWISWIFGDLCLYQSCKLYNDSNDTIEWSSTIEASIFSELQNSEYINMVTNMKNDKVLNVYSLRFIKSQYSDKTTRLALEIFNSHRKSGSLSKSIDDQIMELIVDNVDTPENLKTEWIRFASVCQDIHNRTANKVFAISFDNSGVDFSDDPLVVVLKGNNSLSILKRSTTFELLYFNSVHRRKISDKDFPYADEINVTDLMDLVSLILEYSKGFNDEFSYEIGKFIADDFGSEKEDFSDLITVIFDKYIIKVANETVVSGLLNRLSSINSAGDLINFLSILLTTNHIDYRSNGLGCFTEFSESLINKSIIFNNLVAKQIIFGLMLILLTMDMSKPIELLFRKLRESFKYIKFIEGVSRLVKKDLLIKYLMNVNSGIFIKSGTLNMLLVNSLEQLCDEKFVYYVTSELLVSKNSEIAAEFINYLPPSLPISTVLKGLIALDRGDAEEAKSIFMSSVKEIIDYSKKITDEEKSSLESLRSTISLIFVESEMDYFFNLALLFESKKCYLQSLSLALESSKSIINTNNIGTEKESDVFYKIFELALNIGEYKMSFSAIKEMAHKNRVIPLRKFVYKMFQEGKLGYVIEFNYGEDLDRVDDLIYSMGEESLQSIETLGDVKLALKYYRVCYSLRLKEGDFRGAIEALYRFNKVVGSHYGDAVYTNEEMAEILKNNYLVMLNLMNSFKEEDRWIIGRKVCDGDADAVVCGAKLEEEYLTFADKDKDSSRGRRQGKLGNEVRGKYLM
ncbi:hypothetical protein PMKS-000927 [Pichia membranifaciens]|uniref:Uncharacterized protein n=1 Tax=Pichia membranifaciens TaxID=4926 RepID=A0A1Q2YD44_9ASCO|nr:hypothetical protein PMKS-000927 [Pichia membranifaciens]